MDANSAEADGARSRLNTERERLEAQLHTLERERDQDGPIDSAGGDPGADTTSAATYLGAIADLQNQIDLFVTWYFNIQPRETGFIADL